MERDGSEPGPVRTDVLERVSEGIVALDADLRYTYVNRRAEELLDVDGDEIRGTNVWDAFPAAEGTEAQGAIERALDDGEDVSFERYNDDLDVWFEVHVHPDETGVTICFSDVTDRKRYERELERRTNQLDALVENTDEAIYIKNADCRYVMMNDAAADLFGLDPDAAVGKRDEELFDAESAAAVREVDEELLETGEGVTEEAVRFIDGERYVFLDNKYPYRDEHGDVAGIMGISRDITDRKERERRIERLHEATRDLLDADSPRAVAKRVSDASRDVLDLQMHGVHLHDESAGGLVPVAVSEPVRELIDDLPTLDAGLAWEAFRAGEPRIHDDVTESDRVYDEGTPIRSEMHLPLGDHGVLIVSSPEVDAFDETDVTLAKLLASNAEAVLDQLASERDLRETTTTLEAIIESSPDAIAMIDGDHEVALWNRAATEMFGWDENEVLGREVPFVPDEKRGEFESFRDRLDDGETIRAVETVRETKDGSRIDLSFSATKVEIGDELVGYLGTFQDIGDRVDYERRIERQRDDLELLTQTMSHDIRNDLQVILAYAEMLEDRVGENERAHLEEILASARTAVELTRTASDLAAAMREADGDREPVPLRSTLQSQLDEARATYDSAALTVDGQIPGVSVLADEMLASVFRNFLKNAIQHNDEPVPRVTVSVDADGDAAVVRVADNGPGIPDDQKDEIFGRGEQGLESAGTGIGLYLVRTLVDRYGGAVRVEDNDPKGAVFVVELELA